MPRRRAREPVAPYLAGPGVLIDSNVLIDVLEDDQHWAEWSMTQLEPLIESRRGVVNPIIYAEVAAPYLSVEALESALAPFGFAREPLPWEAAFLAAQAYQRYRRRGGTRRSPLPDFYIGAHASIAGHSLLTRDPARYREYFPKLKVYAPE